MSRPRRYNREVVLAKITDLFLERGFTATSMRAVTALSGINAYSVYNEFENKEKLFLACIDYYIDNSINYIEEILSERPLGLKNIEIFFDNRVDSFFPSSKRSKGCLIFNSVAEKEVLSKEANLKINDYISRIEALLRTCLYAARMNNEINRDKDCDALARYLSCFAFGSLSFGMKKSSKNELKKMTALALSAVKNYTV